MKKKQVINDDYFTQLILYIHNNPVKHGFVKDPYDWPHSSIHQLVGLSLSQNSRRLRDSEKTSVLDWFGGESDFKKAHEHVEDLRSVFD